LGVSGNGARAINDRLLTMAPLDRFSIGRKARETLYMPKKLTARVCSMTAGSLRSSYGAVPELLMRTSRLPTWRTACSICSASVTSSISGVTRSSAMSSVPRVPAYTLFAPRWRASWTSARPMPRLAPVIKTVFCAMFMMISFWGRLYLPDFDSLMCTTDVLAKTHRCLDVFFNFFYLASACSLTATGPGRDCHWRGRCHVPLYLPDQH